VSEASGGTGRRRPQGRVGTIINGKWQVDARLGSGGMATVYAATHRNGHRAALKMLHAQLSRDESTRARFLREGYVANAVAHPGVVQVLDDDVTEDGAAFIVLELLEGETVEARRMRMGGRLGVEDAMRVAFDMLATLSAAHEKGIVHRDIKPDNIFITHEGATKLLDFGLARMKDAQLAGETTKTGVTIGTPEFMPPEQAMGRREDVDAQSDLWALGACVFMMITGRFVHDAESLHEQLIASATKRAPPLSSLAPHVPPGIAAVIDRALELEKADRWKSAREMWLALQEAWAQRAAPRAPQPEPPRAASQAPAPPRHVPSDPFAEEIVEDSVTLLAAPPSQAGPSSLPESELPTLDRSSDPPRDVLDQAPRLRLPPKPDAAAPSAPPRPPVSSAPAPPPPVDDRIVGASGMPMPPPWRSSSPDYAPQPSVPPASMPQSRAPETPRMHPFDTTAQMPGRRPHDESARGPSLPPSPHSAPPHSHPPAPYHSSRGPMVDPFGLMSQPPPAPHARADVTGRQTVKPQSSMLHLVIACAVLIVLCAAAGAWIVLTRTR
jgi:eukaryotic-like serine/threonine-protein kinase